MTEKGFVPDKVTVARGEPVTLVFTRRTEKTCLQEVVVYIEANQRIVRALPLGRPIEIDVVFPRAGELGYACGMAMYGGAIFVK